MFKMVAGKAKTNVSVAQTEILLDTFTILQKSAIHFLTVKTFCDQ